MTTDPIDEYLNRIGTIPLLTSDQERTASHDELVTANLRLVVSIVKHYLGRGMEMMDLIQEGNIGLMRAAKKYDPDLGYKFSTYATHWIRQAVERAILEKSRTIRLPVHMGDSIRHLNKARLHCAPTLRPGAEPRRASRDARLLDRQGTPDCCRRCAVAALA